MQRALLMLEATPNHLRGGGACEERLRRRLVANRGREGRVSRAVCCAAHSKGMG